MKKAIIIGNGSIGSEVGRQIMELGWEVVAVVERGDEWESLSADVVFLAIPTDNGESALKYIEHFVKRDIPVVTCEKGALAHHFDKLAPHLHMVGFNATVGGGTRILSYLRSRNPEKIDSVLGVLNGTLNFIFSKLDEISAAEVLKEVLEKKYAEPGANTFEEIIKGELGDLHKKGIILANFSGLVKDVFTPSKDFVISKDVLVKALENPRIYRFIFSMSRIPLDIIGVVYESEGWHVQMGLCDVSNFGIDLPKGVNNALYIKEGESTYTIIGPGAGPIPTALAMIADAKELLT